MDYLLAFLGGIAAVALCRWLLRPVERHPAHWVNRECECEAALRQENVG